MKMGITEAKETNSLKYYYSTTYRWNHHDPIHSVSDKFLRKQTF